MLRRPRVVLTALALCSALVGAVLASVFDPAASQGTAVSPPTLDKPALTVTAAPVAEQVWPRWIQASGVIAPWQEAVVGATVGGLRLVELSAEVGDRVAKGQVLARFDADGIRAEVAELRAGVAEAEANLDEALSNRQRAQAMGRRSAISEQEVQQYVTGAETARARLESARARLASRELQLSNTVIRAPDSGVISARTATLGSVSQSGQELFRLIRQSRLEWRGELTAGQVAETEPGQRVRLSLPDGATALARIRSISPAMNDQTRLAMVYADITDSAGAKAGMYVAGTIELEARQVLTVPSRSVVIRDGRSYVFVVSGEGEAARVSQRAVDVGRRYGTDAEILSGVEAGERVAAQGAGFLSDLDVVRLVAVSGPETP